MPQGRAFARQPRAGHLHKAERSHPPHELHGGTVEGIYTMPQGRAFAQGRAQ